MITSHSASQEMGKFYKPGNNLKMVEAIMRPSNFKMFPQNMNLQSKTNLSFIIQETKALKRI